MRRVRLTIFLLVIASVGRTQGSVIWEMANGGNGHAYDLIYAPSGWDDAMRAAELLTPPDGYVNGHLLTISNAAENQFITDVFGPFIIYGGASDGAWAGFTDREREGEWRWIDNTPGIWQDPAIFSNPVQTAYVNWASSEPNNAGNVEHSLSIRGSGFWNDYSLELRGDPNCQYLVEWTPASSTVVPAPSSLVTLLGVGAMVFGMEYWKKRRRRM